MADLPRISESEWDVMNVLWDRHPLTARAVAEALEDRRDWSERTVKTLLARLVRKGVLEYETDGRRYRYRPALERAAYVEAESRSFLERVHGGEASPLLVHFLRRGELSAEEVARLRRILDELEERS